MSLHEEFAPYMDLPVQDSWPLAERIGAFFLLNSSPEKGKHPRGMYWEADQLQGVDHLERFRSGYVDRVAKDLIDYDPRDMEVPDMTVTVPLAIHHEKPQQIAKMCEQIEKAAKALNKVQVLVWANAKYRFMDFDTTVKNKRRAHVAAEKNYRVLQGLLRERHTNVHYLSGLQVDKTSAMRMSDIRFTYMAVLLARARKRNYPADHPVMWVDADTTFMSRGTFPSIMRLLGSTPFAHPIVHYSAEWAAGTPPTDTARAFVLDEIIQRHWLKSNPPTLDSDYPEESGLTFTLDTYLKANGVGTRGSMNESGSLIAGYAHRQSAAYDTSGKPGDCLSYDTSSKITLSGRRAIGLVRNHGFVGLGTFRMSSAGPYYLWSEMSEEQQTCSDRHISPDTVLNIENSKLRAMTSAQRAHIEHLAARLWST